MSQNKNTDTQSLAIQADKAENEVSHQTKQEEKSIVIADDDRVIVALCSAIISAEPSCHKVVRTFGNGKELVDYFSELSRNGLEGPVLVLLDYQMPLLDGVEAAKIIKEIKHEAKLVLISALEPNHDDLKYFDAVLRKPFSKKALLDVISTVTRKI